MRRFGKGFPYGEENQTSRENEIAGKAQRRGDQESAGEDADFAMVVNSNARYMIPPSGKVSTQVPTNTRTTASSPFMKPWKVSPWKTRKQRNWLSYVISSV